MKNKKIVLALAIILVVSVICTGCKDADVKNGAKVAVSTKQEKITASEYYDEIKEDNISKLIDMIDQDILDKKYPKTDEETKAVEDQISQIKTTYGSDEETFNNIIKQYFGVENEKELDKVLRLEYKRNKAVDDHVMKNLTDKEIEKYYKEYIYGDMKASHILITPDVKEDATEDDKEKAEKAAKKEAEKVIKKLEDGESFDKLAKKYSDDEASAKNGGDLGYFKYKDMVKEFSEATRNLEKDKYTKKPVKSEYGYHIILKTGQKEKPKLKKVKKEIKETLKDEKLENSPTLYYETLMKIREENDIKWNDSKLKKAYKDFMKKIIDSAEQQATANQNS